MHTDYLIVGAGLTGATLARILTDRGKKVLVIDQNDYIGGACHDVFYGNVPVCEYGGHIFHTNGGKVWKFVNQFSDFYPYEHRVIAKIKNEYYPLPINLLTLNKLYKIETVAQAKFYFSGLHYYGESNFEEKAFSTIGSDLYYKFFYWYTKKQWGVEPKELPAHIFSRLPIRYNFDTRYFSDSHQGMPNPSYTNLITNMLKGIDVQLNTPFKKNMIYDKLIWTGEIDSFFDYRFGKLGYRSVRHEYVIEKDDNFGAATINHTGPDADYARSITFNHFYPSIKNDNFITIKEWFVDNGYPLYPVPTKENKELYKKYKEISTDVIFAGRLGSYAYLNMDQAINSALELGEKL